MKEVRVMKNISFSILLVLLVTIAGCGGTNPPARCDANEYCAPLCKEYDNAICSIDGICFCSDAIPTIYCYRDGDCAEDCSTYDTYSCSGGICYCRDEAEVQCVEDLDCSQMCGNCQSATCTESVCNCSGCESEGTLAVIVVPYDARYNISNAETGDLLFSNVPGAGYYDLPFGDYTVDFMDMVGYNTPIPNTITLNAERQPFVVVSGIYQPIDQLPTVTISAGTTPVNPRVGQQNAEIGSFQIAAGATDKIIYQVALTQGGTLGSHKMLNLLLLRGTDEVANAVSFDGDRVNFVLYPPFVIPAGQTKSFYPQGDIDGGRGEDTIQLFLADTADLLVIDQQYGVRADVINQLTSGDVEMLVLQSARLTITNNGPSAFTVPAGTSDVDVLFLGLTGDVDLTVRDTRLEVRVYDDSGALVSTAQESAYGALKVLQIVDVDTGATLQGPITWVTDGDRYEQAGQVWYEKVFTEDHDLIGGDTRHLAIRLDVDVTFPPGYSFEVVYSLVPEGGSDSYVKDIAANEMLPADHIIGDPLMSNQVTVQ